ncbi:MAG: ribosome maturation factor RimM [Bacteroidota bacterium]
MRKEDCFELGYVIKHRGLNGEVTVFFDADEPKKYETIDAVFIVENDQLIPYMVEYIHPLNDKYILKLEEIDHTDKASKLKGSKLYLPLEALPKLKEEEYYLHDLVGFSLVDDLEGALGKIENVYDITNNLLISIIHLGKEVLIPLHEGVVKRVDKTEGIVHTSLPEGLIALYTED